jgi:hypothetical protein
MYSWIHEWYCSFTCLECWPYTHIVICVSIYNMTILVTTEVNFLHSPLNIIGSIFVCTWLAFTSHRVMFSLKHRHIMLLLHMCFISAVLYAFIWVCWWTCMHAYFVLALPLRSWRDLMFEAVFDTFTNTQAPQFSKFVICTCKPEHYISFTFACFFSYDKGLHWRFPMSALVYLLASLSIFKYSECVLVTLNFTFLSYTFEHVTVFV